MSHVCERCGDQRGDVLLSVPDPVGRVLPEDLAPSEVPRVRPLVLCRFCWRSFCRWLTPYPMTSK